MNDSPAVIMCILSSGIPKFLFITLKHLSECLIILEPVFKLNSHVALANYNNHHGQNELNHG